MVHESPTVCIASFHFNFFRRDHAQSNRDKIARYAKKIIMMCVRACGSGNNKVFEGDILLGCRFYVGWRWLQHVTQRVVENRWSPHTHTHDQCMVITLKIPHHARTVHRFSLFKAARQKQKKKKNLFSLRPHANCQQTFILFCHRIVFHSNNVIQLIANADFSFFDKSFLLRRLDWTVHTFATYKLLLLNDSNGANWVKETS